MSRAATNQRAVHTTSIQQEILQYLQPSSTDNLGIIIPGSLSKEERGLQNHATARFLIPRQHLEAFENDPNSYAMLLPFACRPLGLPLTKPSSAIARFQDDEDLDWSLIAEEWPTFLYDERVGWNRGDVRNGLFRGHVLIRVGLCL